MNSKQITTISKGSTIFPGRISQLADAPDLIYHQGAPFKDWLDLPKVGIVGSRKVSSYGRYVTEKLSRELAGQGIVIISGLALGVDSIAHMAALEAGGRTVAVLPGPIETIYPRSHDQLGKQIVSSGGALISEYPAGKDAFKTNFIARNRLVAALSDVLVITEASQRSGSLHTARFALELGREVAAVPGNITSPTSVGCNNLIKTGAAPITSTEDVLNLLHLKSNVNRPKVKGDTEQEQALLDLLTSGITDGDELQLKSQLPIALYNQSLTMLEISGKIRGSGGNQWSIK